MAGLLYSGKRIFYLFLIFSFFYSLAGLADIREAVSGTTLVFYDLSLPLVSALLVLYRWRALPVLALFFLYLFFFSSGDELPVFSSQLLAALISQGLYASCTRMRSAVSFGRSQLTALRILWLVCCNSLLFILLSHGLRLGFHLDIGAGVFSLPTLINFQWLMNSCLTGIPFCYLILRSFYRPAWGFRYIRQLKTLITTGPSPAYQVIWWVLLFMLIGCLITVRHDLLVFTDYSLLWVLPVMLWGAVRLGHALIAPVWVFTLMLLGRYTDDYISRVTVSDYLHSLVISSTMVFVFSLTIVVAGVLATRNRNYLHHLKQLFRSEPNTGLPNYQALGSDIRTSVTRCLCAVRYPELNTLEQIHGIEFRFEFIRSLGAYLNTVLQRTGAVYYTPGDGIMVRFSVIPDMTAFYSALNAFRFTWQGFPLGLSCGVASTTRKDIIKDLSLAVKNLNICSYISLHQGKPLQLMPQGSGEDIPGQAVVRYALQQAIDSQSFALMAQPILSTHLVAQPVISVTGRKQYHEILVRIKRDNGTLIFPDVILPVARRAGLLPALDFVVTEQTFRYMRSRDKNAPDSHFAVNLTPESLVRPDFVERVFLLFHKYAIEPHRIIFEVVESDIIDNIRVSESLAALRRAGVRIAIDDFGTGASSYARLRTLNADILKIDGSFIRNLQEDEFSRCAVESFCQVARLRKMDIVAEFVEDEETEILLTEMGVDWLQGYHIGKPVPVESLHHDERL